MNNKTKNTKPFVSVIRDLELLKLRLPVHIKDYSRKMNLTQVNSVCDAAYIQGVDDSIELVAAVLKNEIEKKHEIEMRLEMPTGRQIGILTVLSDRGLSLDAGYVQKVVDTQIKNIMKHIVDAGMHAITKK